MDLVRKQCVCEVLCTDRWAGADTAIVSPTLIAPLKAGGFSTVACNPAVYSPLPVSRSVLCRLILYDEPGELQPCLTMADCVGSIDNTLIGVGTASFGYTVLNSGSRTSNYLIAFTTTNPDWPPSTVTTTTTTESVIGTVTAHPITPTTVIETDSGTTTLTGPLTVVTVSSCSTTTVFRVSYVQNDVANFPLTTNTTTIPITTVSYLDSRTLSS